jgi:hypothetical protein
MPELISLREYARRKNVSLTAVQNAIKSGRITPASYHDSGRIKEIDWETQEAAWEANSKAPQKRPHTNAGGRPRLDGMPPAAPARQAPGAPADAPTDGKGGMSLADIQRAREMVKLQIDNEKLKEVRRESVSAAEVEKQGAKLAAVVIRHLYAIADKIADELAGMSDPHAIAALITSQIDEAVGELRKAYGRT